MQALGALAIIFAHLAFLHAFEFNTVGTVLFILSIGTFLGSIISSFIEILMSSKALNILLAILNNESTS